MNKFRLVLFRKILLDRKILRRKIRSMKFSRLNFATKSRATCHGTATPTIAILLFSLVFASGCVSHNPSRSTSSDTSAQEFERLYSAWHHDLETEGDGSDNVTWEVGRPSFRNIVAMGKPALPYLKRKLEEDKDSDALLAFAVVEICGWDIHDYQTKRGVGDFRDNVLKKLRQQKMTPDRGQTTE